MTHILSRRLTARTIVYLVLAVALTLVSAVYFVRFLFKPGTGLVVNFPEVVAEKDAATGEQKILFAPKTPFSPAVTAGLIPLRDQIISINGRPVETTRDVVEAEADIWAFEPFPVAIVRDGEPLELTITPAFNLMRFEWIMVFLFAAVLGFVSFYLVFHMTEEQSSLWILLACLAYMVFTCVKPFYYESFFSNLLVHFGKTAPWFLLIFALSFPRPKGSRRLRIGLYGLITISYMLFVIIRLALYSRWIAAGVETYLSRYRALGRINNAAEGLAYVAFAALLGVSYVRERAAEQRKQLEWILAGCLIALPTFFIFDQLPYILGDTLSFRWSTGHFANLFLAVFPVFYVMGMVRKRSFDFRFFLSRYFAVVVLGAVIWAFFGLAYAPFVESLRTGYGMDLMVASLLVTMILFLVLFPLRSLIVRIGQRALYGGVQRGSEAYLRRMEQSNRDLVLRLESRERGETKAGQQAHGQQMSLLCRSILERLRTPTLEAGRNLVELQKDWKRLVDPEDADYAAGERSLASLLAANQEIKELISQITAVAKLRAPLAAEADLLGLARAAVSQSRKRGADVRLVDAEGNGELMVFADPQDVVWALEAACRCMSEHDGGDAVDMRIYGQGAQGCVELAPHEEAEWGRAALRSRDARDLGLGIAKMRIERNGGSLDRTKGGVLQIRLPRTEDRAPASEASETGPPAAEVDG